MSLRQTAFLIICVTFTGLFVILYAISRSNIQASFDYLEREEVVEELTRASKAVEENLRALGATSADWAFWDDTYRFVQDGNAAFIESNLTYASLETINIDLLLLYDDQGHLVLGRARDAATETLEPAPQALAEQVAASSLPRQAGRTQRQATGTLTASGQTWLLAACPVLSSSREGPARGVLVMGRLLDAAMVQRLADMIMLDIAVTDLRAPGLPRRLTDAAAALVRTSRPQVVPDGEDRVQGFGLLRDVEDRPALLLSVTLPRLIHRQGQLTQRNNVLFLAIIGVTFGLAMLFLVENRILSRISSLSDQIRQVGDSASGVRQTAVAGNDEISHLSQAINAMLAALDHARARYALATRAARVGVWELQPDTGQYYVDPSFQELLGYGDGEVQAGLDVWMERVHPEDRERVRGALQACLDGRSDEYVGEQRMVALDGDVRWILVRGRLVADDGGRRFVGTNTDVTDLKRAEENIRELTGALIAAQETERGRIARDLHDDVAQDLSAAKIAAETLRDGVILTSPAVEDRLAEFSALLSRTIRSVRQISYDLRPPDLEYLGLPQALQRLCDDFSTATGIRADFAGAGLDGLVLGQDVAINVYRIVQEGLSNVRRHAGATAVSVRLVESFPKLIVRIKDDGRGFDVAARLEPARRERRMGLASMRERAGLFGGSLRVVSAPGQGCLVVAEVVYAGEVRHGGKTDPDR